MTSGSAPRLPAFAPRRSRSSLASAARVGPPRRVASRSTCSTESSSSRPRAQARRAKTCDRM
eukprot:1614850-Pyramimonas_sp.AAC.1